MSSYPIFLEIIMNSDVKDRQESDRVAPKGIFSAVFSRPEIGPIGVM